MPHVAQTLVLSNNSLVAGNFLAVNGAATGAAVYDPGRGVEFFPIGNSLAELSISAQRVEATIPVGTAPHGVAYDPVRAELFVANSGSGNVTVVSNPTLTTLTSIQVGSGPNAVVYDSATGDLFVANYGSNTVSVISDVSNSVVHTIPVGFGPIALAYDSLRGEVVVANSASDNVSFISDSTYSVMAQVPVGSGPTSIAFDSAKGVEAVTNTGSNNLSLISDSSYRVSRSIPCPSSPNSVAYDAKRGELFVSDFGSNQLQVISDVNNSTVATVAFGSGPDFVAYDAANDTLTVANSWTISLVSDTNDTVTGTVETGTSPGGVAVDTQRGEVFVANDQENEITGVSSSTNRIVSVVHGPAAFGLTYDSHTDEIFSANWLTSSISEFNATTTGPVTNISTSIDPYAIGYDSLKHEVFVAGYTSSYAGVVQVINDTTERIVANISVPYVPTAVVFDSGTGQLFVPCYYANVVAVIDDSNNSVVAEINTGGYPETAAYDPVQHQVYVSDYRDARVSIISDRTDTLIGNISVGSNPVPLAVIPKTGLLLVGVLSGNDVTVISEYNNTVLGTVGVGSDPWSIGIDPSDGEAYVSCSSSGTLSILSRVPSYSIRFGEVGLPGNHSWAVSLDGSTNSSSGSSVSFTGTNGTYSFSVAVPSGYVSNPTYGTVVVNGTNVTQLVNISQPIPLTFNEVGLPSGTTWWVNLTAGPTNHSTGSSLGFGVANGSYQFSVASANKEYEAPGGQVTITGNATNDSVRFAVVTSPVRFGEQGLPAGAPWWVNLSNQQSLNTTGSSIEFNETNGTYEYAVGALATFVASPTNGTFHISGTPVNVSIDFSRLFSVEFTETGLPAGSLWSLNLTGAGTIRSTNQSIAFSVPNGTYSYQPATANPTFSALGGNVTVVGAAVVVSVSFSRVFYSVTFTESGLPTGTEWWVNLTNGPSLNSTGTTNSISEVNGTYAYTVASADTSYSAPGGTFTVSGSTTAVTVTFSLVRFAVTFTESGLPTGTEWWVNLTNGLSLNSTGSTISSPEVNGTYTYTVAAVDKSYSASGGTFTVSGATVAMPVTFSSVRYAVTFTESGLPTGTEWWVNLTNGQVFSSTTGSVTFLEPNATYSFMIGTVPGFRTNITTGTLTVQGSPQTVAVTFASNSPGVPGSNSSSGGFSLVDWILVGVILIAVLVAGVALARRGKRRNAVLPPTFVASPSPSQEAHAERGAIDRQAEPSAEGKPGSPPESKE